MKFTTNRRVKQKLTAKMQPADQTLYLSSSQSRALIQLAQEQLGLGDSRRVDSFNARQSLLPNPTAADSLWRGHYATITEMLPLLHCLLTLRVGFYILFCSLCEILLVFYYICSLSEQILYILICSLCELLVMRAARYARFDCIFISCITKIFKHFELFQKKNANQ